MHLYLNATDLVFACEKLAQKYLHIRYILKLVKKRSAFQIQYLSDLHFTFGFNNINLHLN